MSAIHESNPILKQGDVEWLDLHARCRFEVRSHSLDFKVRQGDPQPDGSWVFTLDGADTSMDKTGDFALAERFIDGFVKWDGCTHVWMGDENAYLHLCGGGDIAEMHAILSRVFILASQEIPNFDADCADLEKLSAPRTPEYKEPA